MHWKYSANAGFFGARRDRFNQYQPERTLEEKFSLVAQVKGITGIELKYPGDLDDLALVGSLLETYNLTLSAVNVNIKSVAQFRHGALSSRSRDARLAAVQLLKEGMDIAAEMCVGLVSTCPVVDGYDYPFQVNYSRAWGDLISGLRETAAHRRDVDLLLEFQPHDPNAKILLRNVGMVLFVCGEVGAENIGANLDVGHSIAAGESPAESAALLARKGLLKYLHSNDNTGEGGDWDMISGSVHFWHWIELLYTLIRGGYEGWIGADISPRHLSPVAAYQTNIMMIERMTDMLQSTGLDKIDLLMERDGNMPEIYDLLTRNIGG